MSRKLRRRSLLLIAAFAGFSSTARAQSFSVFRYDDDVSALSDPAARKSPYDALKFVPLGPSPDRYLSLGRDDRERVEYSSDAALGARFKSANAYEMHRLLGRVTARMRGEAHGPITRLISPHDLGERLKPFIFLDFFSAEITPGFGFPMHPHSGIATLTWQPRSENAVVTLSHYTHAMRGGDDAVKALDRAYGRAG